MKQTLKKKLTLNKMDVASLDKVYGGRIDPIETETCVCPSQDCPTNGGFFWRGQYFCNH